MPSGLQKFSPQVSHCCSARIFFVHNNMSPREYVEAQKNFRYVKMPSVILNRVNPSIRLTLFFISIFADYHLRLISVCRRNISLFTNTPDRYIIQASQDTPAGYAQQFNQTPHRKEPPYGQQYINFHTRYIFNPSGLLLLLQTHPPPGHRPKKTHQPPQTH